MQGEGVIFGIIRRWGAVGLGVLRPMLPGGEMASWCHHKGACGSFGLARMSPPRSGGAGFVTRGDSGSWVDAWQTRCLSGTKPELPGTSKPIWGLLPGTELHSQPPGMVRSGFALYFLIFLYISLNSGSKPPCCTRGQCTDVPLGDTASKPTLIPMCLCLVTDSGIYLHFIND